MKFHRQNGESLLEVLVSLVLFCVAIIGLLGTQQRLLIQMFQTESAVIANQLASSLAEQLLILPASTIAQLDSDINTVQTLNCPPSSCDSSWANSQLGAWQQRLETELSGSEFQLCLDNSPADGSPEQSLCAGGSRMAIKIWPQDFEFPIVAALDL